MTENKTTESNRILEHHISKSYNMNIQEFSQFLAEKYIKDKSQRKIFIRQGVWLKVKLNYIGALLLTEEGKEIFTPKDIRDKIRDKIIPSLIEIRDDRLGGMLLTSDVHTTAKDRKWHNGYPCLQLTDRGKYKFIGFVDK